ncbi:MAG: hypothetical protein RR086_06770 [Clostridia bacterium]
MIKRKTKRRIIGAENEKMSLLNGKLRSVLLSVKREDVFIETKNWKCLVKRETGRCLVLQGASVANLCLHHFAIGNK